MTVEYLLVTGIGAAVLFAIGNLCYDSLPGGCICLAGVPVFVRAYKRWRDEKSVQGMRLEFKDLLYALSSGLKAGYSIENAWMAAEQDLKVIYPAKSILQKQVSVVSAKLRLNIPIEEAVQEMADTCELEEIYSFAEVLHTAKRTGGNMVHMMEKTSNLIAEKVEVEQEIHTLLSGKRMEQRIMCGMPLFLLLYLRISNPDYIGALYHNTTGILVVSICMAGVAAAAIWGAAIMKIEV